MVALSFAAGRYAEDEARHQSCRCFPGGNPVLLAKQWAGLDGCRVAARSRPSGSAWSSRRSSRRSA